MDNSDIFIAEIHVPKGVSQPYRCLRFEKEKPPKHVDIMHVGSRLFEGGIGQY